MKRLFTILALTVAALADEPKPTIESLEAENARLREQLDSMRKAAVLELRLKDGALQACREVVGELQKAAPKPTPKVVP